MPTKESPRQVSTNPPRQPQLCRYRSRRKEQHTATSMTSHQTSQQMETMIRQVTDIVNKARHLHLSREDMTNILTLTTTHRFVLRSSPKLLKQYFKIKYKFSTQIRQKTHLFRMFYLCLIVLLCIIILYFVVETVLFSDCLIEPNAVFFC